MAGIPRPLHLTSTCHQRNRDFTGDFVQLCRASEPTPEDPWQTEHASHSPVLIPSPKTARATAPCQTGSQICQKCLVDNQPNESLLSFFDTKLRSRTGLAYPSPSVSSTFLFNISSPILFRQVQPKTIGSFHPLVLIGFL